MKLSAWIIKNVDNVNAWDYGNNWTVRQDADLGEAASLYFQLVDLDRGSAEEPETRPGIRYIPQGTVVTMKVRFPNIDDDAEIELTATQPFADDKSIFKIDLLPSHLPGSGAVFFELTIDGVVKKWRVEQAMEIEKINAGSC